MLCQKYLANFNFGSFKVPAKYRKIGRPIELRRMQYYLDYM